jgi:hypothetical protein
LADTFVGAYLQGSFAVGDFDRHSHADFIIVVRDELSDHQVIALQSVHERIYGLGPEWAHHLEGSYFPAAILRDYRQRAKPLWYLDHGTRSLVRSDHCNTLVVRWVVREHGVALAGSTPATLVDPIRVDALRREIGETIRNWGKGILTRSPIVIARTQRLCGCHRCRQRRRLQPGEPPKLRSSRSPI